MPDLNNNDFANRVTLNLDETSFGNNVGYTQETGEPTDIGSKTAWWEFTPPSTGTYTLHTAGSDFDTKMAIYTGSAVNALTLVGAADDDSGPGDTSAITTTLTSGLAYKVAVAGWSSGSGSIHLTARSGTDQTEATVSVPTDNTQFIDELQMTAGTSGENVRPPRPRSAVNNIISTF